MRRRRGWKGVRVSLLNPRNGRRRRRNVAELCKYFFVSVAYKHIGITSSQFYVFLKGNLVLPQQSF
jgi:hypothetical protein